MSAFHLAAPRPQFLPTYFGRSISPWPGWGSGEARIVERRPEYAIAGCYAEFLARRREDTSRRPEIARTLSGER